MSPDELLNQLKEIIRLSVQAGRDEERERCAAIAEQFAREVDHNSWYDPVGLMGYGAKDIARLIRVNAVNTL